MRLLVVDWDFFFAVPELGGADREGWQLFDWGHHEDQPIFFEAIWPTRAAGFVATKRALPTTSGEEMAFWDRFDIAPRAQLLYADSNMYAAHERVSQHVDEVWLFDAHHDAGYHEGARGRMIMDSLVTCEDWMIAYNLAEIELHMRYPRWRAHALELEPAPEFDLDRQVDDGEPVPGVFDRIFVCRSPAWVPPWLDGQFVDFVKNAPVARAIAMDEMKSLRAFEQKQVDMAVRMIHEAHAANEAAAVSTGSAEEE